MVGRALNRIRYLWIVIILSVLLIGAVILFFVHSSRTRDSIPQKGVFVFREEQKNIYGLAE